MATKAKQADETSKQPESAAILEYLRDSMPAPDDVEVKNTLDFLILVLLLDRMTIDSATKAYRAFKANFVDWNEVRISTAGEVQEVLKQADEPLEFALVIKEFLNRLFLDVHHVGLEFLKEMTNSEVKAFFKKSGKLGQIAVQSLLHRVKEYPAMPMSPDSVRLIERLGWVDPSATLLRKQKDVFALFEPDQIFSLQAWLGEHARVTCTEEPQCVACGISSHCEFGVTATKKKTKKRATKKKK